jgi:hypothetical protein
VIGNARERKPLAFAQLAGRQGDAENGGDAFGVLAKGLVKIAEPEEDDGVRMLALDLQVLIEDGGRLQRSLP